MNFNVTGSDQPGNFSPQKKPDEPSPPIHNIPQDVLAYALSFLENKEVRPFSRASKYDNKVSLIAIKNRFSDSIQKAIQTAISEIEKMEKTTTNPEVKNKLNLAKERLATINAISLDKSDWSNLKSSIEEVKDHIEKVLTSLYNLELPPSHVNIFRLWTSINTEGLLSSKEKKSLKPVISEFANLFDILPNERKQQFLNHLLRCIKTEEWIDYISLFDKLPVSAENDSIRKTLLKNLPSAITSKVLKILKKNLNSEITSKEHKLLNELKKQILKISDETTQNSCKIEIATFFVVSGSIDDALQIIDSIPPEKRLMVETGSYQAGYWFTDPNLKDQGPCREYGFALCLIAATLFTDNPAPFIKIYELFPSGEIKNTVNEVILEKLKTLRLFENTQIVKENITKLMGESDVITNSNFKQELGRAISDSLKLIR